MNFKIGRLNVSANNYFIAQVSLNGKATEEDLSARLYKNRLYLANTNMGKYTPAGPHFEFDAITSKMLNELTEAQVKEGRVFIFDKQPLGSMAMLSGFEAHDNGPYERSIETLNFAIKLEAEDMLWLMFSGTIGMIKEQRFPILPSWYPDGVIYFEVAVSIPLNTSKQEFFKDITPKWVETF